MQNVVWQKDGNAICTNPVASPEVGDGMRKINPFVFSGFLRAGRCWHGSRDSRGMTLLLISFLVLGFLLCALVVTDEKAAEAVESARVRSFEKY